MGAVFRSPSAIVDLQGIAKHIAEDNPTAAYHWLESIEALFRLMSTQPMMGEPYKSRRLGSLRRISHGNYVIYYRPIHDGVDVLRVIHGARNERTILD